MAALAYRPEEPRITAQEYLALERETGLRHEWIDGRLWPMGGDVASVPSAMAGSSFSHVQIIANLMLILGIQLRSGGCRPLPQDLRVKIPQTNSYVYPDVLVLCGEPQFDDEIPHTLLNPQVVIEVLSPSTERYDKAAKWEHYRTIESLTDYILVAQDKISVQHYKRLENNDWLLHIAETRDEELQIVSIDCRLPLGEIYERIEFATPEAA